MIKFAFSCEFAHICHCYKKRKNVSCDYVFTKEIYKKKTLFSVIKVTQYLENQQNHFIDLVEVAVTYLREIREQIK